ncbi:MAG: hypothetical protein IMF11_22685 [Proteobacteria bacterium]|nr:hypothetical protein [Pseudomonadota bacterium]
MVKIETRRIGRISAILLLVTLLSYSCTTTPKYFAISDSIKDGGAYKDREVFLIADTDWKNVLSLVPVTVWTDRSHWICVKPKIRKYPTLIYHKEGLDKIDADSIIHFLQQYRPQRVTVVGKLPKKIALLVASHPSIRFGAGLRFTQLKFITPDDYLSYWKKFDSVVYVSDDYDTALMAATYASLINVPLIIKNSELDTSANLKGKRIICIGKMPPSIRCVASYKKSALMKHYLELTGTRNLVLVNSKDLKIGISGSFQPEKTPLPIGTTFSKLSLGAPILASAKHALLLSVNLDANDCGPYEGTSNEQFIDTDDYVKKTLQDLYGWYHLPTPSQPDTHTKIKPRFLTIVASPKAIPYWSDCNNSRSGAADWQYGSINNEDPLLHVGRIYSITISGVSAYIARALFYNVMLNDAYTANTYTGLSIAAPNFAPDQDNAQEIRDETVDDGYNTICFTWHGAASQPNCDVYTNIQSTDYQDKQFVSFADHGSSTGWGGTLASEDIPWLDIPYTISLACLTNNFWGGGSLTFGPTWIRKAGISYHASIPSTNGYDWELWATQELTTAARQSLGEIATNLINRTDYDSEVKRQYILLGDPTLVPYAKEVTW